MTELSADRPVINQTCSESVPGTSGVGKKQKKHLETLLISPLNMFPVGHGVRRHLCLNTVVQAD